MRPREHHFSASALIGMLIIVVAMVVGLYYISDRLGKPESADTAAVGADIGGPFTLTDENGKTVTDADFRGSLMLVFFGYTHCPDVCPVTLSTFGATLDDLGDDARDVVPIFITIDPERDTVARMKTFMSQFDPRIVALTGTSAQIAAAAKAYHVFYKKAEAGTHHEAGAEAGHEGHDMSGHDMAYDMNHTSIIYLMDREGHYLAHFDQNTSPADMAAGIAKNL